VSTDEQKLSCTFTLDVPGLGYLEGGTEADVRSLTPTIPALIISINLRENKRRKRLMIDPYAPEIRAPILASTNPIIKVRPHCVFTTHKSDSSGLRERS